MKTNENNLTICISIVSRRRHKLLNDVLESLTKLIIPDGISVSVAVIENDDAPKYAQLIETYKNALHLKHVIEQRPGLVHARNRSLDELRKTSPDWAANFDDDQIIDPDWLVAMLNAIRTYPDTKIFAGNWFRIPPPDMVYWHPQPAPPRKFKTGAITRELSGANNIVHRSVFLDDGLGLKYDEAFNFSGGEDTDFGYQFLAKGGNMRFVKEALSYEEIHPERATLKGRLERYTGNQFIMARIRAKHKNILIASLWSLQAVYRNSVLGVVNLLLTGVALPFQKRWAMIRFGKSLACFARVKGVFQYYTGKNVEMYRDDQKE